MVALLLLLLVLPSLLLVAAAIVLCGRAPIFRQRRVGLDGSTFMIWKLRTVDAAGQRVRPRRDRVFARLSRWLRRNRIDELPQLLNIATGDMTFVGPRPLLEAELRDMGAAWRQRQSVKPGLTGLAQLSGGNRLALDAKLRLDLSYIARKSIRLDALILACTLPGLLRGVERTPTRLLSRNEEA